MNLSEAMFILSFNSLDDIDSRFLKRRYKEVQKGIFNGEIEGEIEDLDTAFSVIREYLDNSLTESNNTHFNELFPTFYQTNPIPIGTLNTVENVKELPESIKVPKGFKHGLLVSLSSNGECYGALVL